MKNLTEKKGSLIRSIRKPALLPPQRTRSVKLPNICWKKENTKFKNDYDKAIEDVLASYSEEEKEKIQKAIEETLEDIESKEYLIKGNRAKLIIRK